MDSNDETSSPEKIEITGIFRLNVIKRHLSQSNANASKNSINELKKSLLDKSFKYTNLSDGVMTNEQREEYERNGIIVVRKLLKDDQLDKYKSRFQKICSEKIQVPGMTVMKDVTIAKSEFLEGEKAITKIQDFTNDDELFEYCCQPEIVQVCNIILSDHQVKNLNSVF